nr:NAD(P)/FAD-dependent oxidoreductase [Angustibacter aerolatus]
MSTGTTVEHLDVLIVGAGLSGIGAAYYLQRDHPQRSVALLEAREASGGTWDLFRYPGVRSDSDLHTFGYEFEPWRAPQAVAGADQILAYLRDTAARHGIDRRTRYHHRVVSASWSSDDARWTVDVERTDTGEHVEPTCSWLFCAGGYYRYDRGHTPRRPGSTASPAPSCTPSTGPPTSTCATGGCWWSAAGPPPSPSCRRSPRRPPT